MRMQQQNGKYACASKVRVVNHTNADLSSVVEVFMDMDMRLVNESAVAGSLAQSAPPHSSGHVSVHFASGETEGSYRVSVAA